MSMRIITPPKVCIEAPPPKAVLWHAWRRGKLTTEPTIVIAQLWSEARARAAIALGVAPEEVCVTRKAGG